MNRARDALRARPHVSGSLILKYLNNTRQNVCGRAAAHPYRTAQDPHPVVNAAAIRLAPVLAKSHDKRHKLRIRRRSNVSAAPYYLTEAAIFLPNNYCISYFSLLCGDQDTNPHRSFSESSTKKIHRAPTRMRISFQKSVLVCLSHAQPALVVRLLGSTSISRLLVRDALRPRRWHR